jgi:ElaB/YqjD/DUF883 family membrane-anchored ribosome-binding protein
MNTTAKFLGRAELPVRQFLDRMRELLDALNEEGVETTTATRERLAAAIDSVQARLDSLVDSAADGAGSVDEIVQEHPWGAVLAGAVVGIAVGCAATAGAFSLIEDPDFVSQADQYRRGVVRRSRPYVGRARKLARNYWPF